MLIETKSAAWPAEAQFAPPGQPFRYRVYGLSVASGLQLALPGDPEPGTPDVEIQPASPEFFAETCGCVELAPDDGWWYRHGFLDDGSIYLRWDGLFHFWISGDGRRIACGSLGAETMEAFQVYLLGHSLGFALVNQGEEPLHATVVTCAGKTVALLGACGAGKSTLASYLLRTGGRLLTDDLLRLEADGERLLAHPGPHRIKLLPEPAGLYMSECARGVEMNPGSGKLVIPLKEDYREERPAPLGALLRLDWSEDGEVRLEPLAGREAFLSLIAATFNIRVQTPERLARQFRFAETVCSRVPVYRLSYPRDFGVMPRLREMIWPQVAL